jgi:pyruvate dehydrogenase E1 component alpha subunit
MKINNIQKKKLYYEMVRIRMVEKKIAELYHEQEIRCPVHLSIGQEAIAVGVCQNLNRKDKIVTAHRSHAHYLAKGGSLKKMISELYGKYSGCAKGLGGSMHLVDFSVGVYAAIPIVGSSIPIGVGIAWANKLKRNKNIVVAFFGDGATEEGVFLESLDFSALHDLPIIFVCENNEYSVYSHISKRQSKKRSITKIANSLGIKSINLNGNSVDKVFSITNKIVKYVKKFSEPYLIELKTFRNIEHCGPNEDDDLNYRKKNYLNVWKKRCPIRAYENYLDKRDLMTSKKKNLIKKKIDKEINKAFEFAKKDKFPKKILLKKYIYA